MPEHTGGQAINLENINKRVGKLAPETDALREKEFEESKRFFEAVYDNFTLNAPDGNRYWIDPQPFYMNVDFSGQVLTSNQVGTGTYNISGEELFNFLLLNFSFPHIKFLCDLCMTK